mgnify:CR=1 FL=1
MGDPPHSKCGSLETGVQVQVLSGALKLFVKKIDLSIVVPTYNESENIERLCFQINRVMQKERRRFEIIIVDDSSPDGTSYVVEKLKKHIRNIKLIVREKKMGLASAVLDGFKESKGEIIGAMDADLSHSPDDIPKLVEPIEKGEALFTIGSRYVPGAEIIDFPKLRKMLSLLGASSVKLIPIGRRMNLKDPLSGFFFVKRDVIENILDKINPKGFKLSLDIISLGEHKGKIKEIPIKFLWRKKGTSKLNIKDFYEYSQQWFEIIIKKFYKKINN